MTTLESVVEYLPEAAIALFPAAFAILAENVSDDLIRSGIGPISEENYGRLKHNLEYWALLGAGAVGTVKLWIHVIVIESSLKAYLILVCILFLGVFVRLYNRGPGPWANPVDTPKWMKWVWSLFPIGTMVADMLVKVAKGK